MKPTIDSTLATIQRVARHTHMHQSRDSHARVLAGLADRIEANGAATCSLVVDTVHTGTRWTLTVARGGTLAGRVVSIGAGPTTWWVFDGSTCTRVSMTAFGRHFLTPNPAVSPA